MVSPSAMVVADHPAATKDLDEGLRAAGFTVRHATAAGPTDHPDVVLLSASLGRQRIASFAQQFAGRPKPPTVLVFPQDDLDALETCVRAGFDYVTPPFRPGLLCGRIQRQWERTIAHRIQANFLPTRL